MYGYGYTTLISSMGKGVGTPALTARTTAFATATGITDTTILNALNTFDLGLISNGLDTKMKAVYPFVGGTATTQKFNFMDARDLDVAFRLQFFGGGTFSNNGYQPNGTNAYADTFIKPSTSLLLNSTHISYYSRTNIGQGVYDMGTTANDTNDYLLLNSRNQLDNFRVSVNDGGLSDTPNVDSRGLFIANRAASNIKNSFKNGIKNLDSIATSGALSARSIYIGAINYVSAPLAFSSRQCAFSSIGNGLTDTEATTFYNLVQAMQTSLSRQV